MTLTRQRLQIIDAAATIASERPTLEDTAFMARQLVQATLPHSDPGEVPVWKRVNGNLKLSIRPGWNSSIDQPYGYPYGTIPRLLLFWLTTEALRTNDRRLALGSSLAEFMRELGLDPSRGGKRSDAHRLRDQMNRLFQATISFEWTIEKNGDRGDGWLNMQIAPKGMLWWDIKQPEQKTLWGSWVELGEDFFKAITSAPVPVDVRALKALKRSPLALDLYAWASYTVFIATKTGKPRSVSWNLLHKQFGADYSETRNFQTKAVAAFRKIQTVFPGLSFSRVEGGITIHPSKTVITAKAQKSKHPSDIIEASFVELERQHLASEATTQDSSKVSVEAFDQAVQLCINAGTGWDTNTLEKQFYDYVKSKGIPRNLDRAFLGFVKKKAHKQP